MKYSFDLICSLLIDILLYPLILELDAEAQIT